MKIKRGDKTGDVLVKLEPGESQLPAQESSNETGSSRLFQLKGILVPVDFSNCSKKALRYAIPFAQQFNAELILFHVIQPYVPVSGMEPVAEVKWDDNAQVQLKEFQEMIDDRIPSKTVARAGNPHIEIVEAAKKFKVDLIILSTHERTGLAHMLLGSTTEKVVRHATCPVLVVREHEHEFITES